MSLIARPSAYLPLYSTGEKTASGFGNVSIADKVPLDMLFMVDPQW